MLQPGARIYPPGNLAAGDGGGTLCCFAYFAHPAYTHLYALCAGHSLESSNEQWTKPAVKTLRGVPTLTKYALGTQDYGFARVLVDEGVARITAANFTVAGAGLALRGIKEATTAEMAAANLAVLVAGGESGLQRGVIDNTERPAGWSADYFGIAARNGGALQLTGGDSGSPVLTEDGLLVGLYTGRQANAAGDGHAFLGFRASAAFAGTPARLATWESREEFRAAWNAAGAE